MGTAGWVWWVRPRQLVEVRDDSGKISVRVPRGWVDEGRGSESGNTGVLWVGPIDDPRVRVTVIVSRGTFEFSGRCGRKSEEVTEAGSADQLWMVRDCPDGQITLFMSKSFSGYGYAPVTAGVEIRANNEKSARKVLDSFTYRLGS